MSVEDKTAKPPLDTVATLLFGAYLLDMDLLDQEKAGSERHKELTRKTGAQRRLIELCQEWNGEGNGDEHLVSKIRKEVPPLRKEMIAALQDAGIIDKKS